MIEYISDWVLKLTGTVLFIKIVEIILPSGKYKKYVNLVTGLVVVILIITPFIDLLKKDTEFEGINLKNRLTYEKNIYKGDKKEFGDIQKNQIISLYKEKIKQHIMNQLTETEKGSVRDIEFTVNEDEHGGKYGEIEKVTVIISQKSDEKQKNSISVQKIEIGNIGRTGIEKSVQDSRTTEKIKNKFSAILNIDKGMIEVVSVNSED